MNEAIPQENELTQDELQNAIESEYFYQTGKQREPNEQGIIKFIENYSDDLLNLYYFLMGWEPKLDVKIGKIVWSESESKEGLIMNKAGAVFCLGIMATYLTKSATLSINNHEDVYRITRGIADSTTMALGAKKKEFEFDTELGDAAVDAVRYTTELILKHSLAGRKQSGTFGIATEKSNLDAREPRNQQDFFGDLLNKNRR